MKKLILLIFLGAAFVAAPTNAASFSFNSRFARWSTGYRLANRGSGPGKIEIESADDFIGTDSGGKPYQRYLYWIDSDRRFAE